MKRWGRRSPKASATRRRRRGRAQVAVVMHAMWRDGTSYTDGRTTEAATALTAKDRMLLGGHA